MEAQIREWFSTGQFDRIVQTLRALATFSEDGRTENHFFFFLSRAELRLRNGEPQRAHDDAERAANIKPSDSNVRELMGRIARQLPFPRNHGPYIPPPIHNPGYVHGPFTEKPPDITDPDVDS